MTSSYFVVVDPADGTILRTGQCWPEDAPLQGDTVLVFAEDPHVAAHTHRWAAQDLSFVSISESHTTDHDQ